jgi:hypothetical protein
MRLRVVGKKAMGIWDDDQGLVAEGFAERPWSRWIR